MIGNIIINTFIIFNYMLKSVVCVFIKYTTDFLWEEMMRYIFARSVG